MISLAAMSGRRDKKTKTDRLGRGTFIELFLIFPYLFPGKYVLVAAIAVGATVTGHGSRSWSQNIYFRAVSSSIRQWTVDVAYCGILASQWALNIGANRMSWFSTLA